MGSGLFTENDNYATNGNAARLCSQSDFAICNDLEISSFKTFYRPEGSNSTYWLRSATENESKAYCVAAMGTLATGASATRTNGIRPAIRLIV